MSITKEQLQKRVDENGNLTVDDVVEASVLAMFVVQKLGKASVEEVREKLEAMSGKIDEHLLMQAVEALQARGLVSYARGRQKGTGESVRMFKPRQSIWAAPPEVAHITELLPALVATPEAQDLIETLNAGEAEGEGEKKSKRKLGYDEYVEVEAEFLTLDELLGSQPPSPRLDQLVKASPYNGVEADLRFWRNPGDGAILIASDAVRGWLRTGLRTEGYSDSVASYVGVSAARIYPKKKLQQVCLPIVDSSGGGQGRGKGTPTYECVQPGERLMIRFRLPRRGFMSPAQFKAWLVGYAPRPIRGISPARGARFGKLALVGFREVADLKSATGLINSVVEELPEEAKEFAMGVLAEMGDTDVNLRRPNA
jgi:hypothetical protein